MCVRWWRNRNGLVRSLVGREDGVGKPLLSAFLFNVFFINNIFCYLSSPLSFFFFFLIFVIDDLITLFYSFNVIIYFIFTLFFFKIFYLLIIFLLICLFF